MFKYIILILFCFPLYGRSILVDYNNLKFKLEILTDKIIYKDLNAEIFLTKNKCNEYIYSNLEKKIKKFEKEVLINQNPEGSIQVHLEQLNIKLDKKSEYGIFTLGLYDLILKSILEEKLMCQGKR